jgi:F-type H+-transporting ATPase subunit b
MLPLYLAAQPAEESGPNPVIPNGAELIIGLLTFGIVVFVLMKYAWPQMEATFQARRDAIEGGIKRAEEAQAEAQRLLTEYRQQLSEARTEAAQIRDNARAEGQRIIEEMRTTAQEESGRIVARGEEQLTMQRQQVVRELRGEIGTLATGLAERVVGETLADDPARQRTIDRFLDDLDLMAQSVPAGVGAGGATTGAAGGSAGGGSAGDASDGGGPSGGVSGGGAPGGGVSGGGASGGGASGGGSASGGSGESGESAGSGGGTDSGSGPDDSGGRGGGRSRRRG